MLKPLMWRAETATCSSNMGVIHGEMELWADDPWLNLGSAVSSVDDSDPFISECAVKRQHSGLLSAPIAGQGSLHSRATDTEERARRIDETESDEVSVQNHCLQTESVQTCITSLSWHHQLSSRWIRGWSNPTSFCCGLIYRFQSITAATAVERP